MEPEEVARELGISGKRLRGWLRLSFPRQPAEKWGRWSLTPGQVAVARQRFAPGARGAIAARRSMPATAQVSVPRRARSDEAYVIDLLDELFGENASRQHTFSWLVGDPGRDGLPRRLPVDAYYSTQSVVVEYRERQHDEPVAFFDGRSTVSGVNRGEQRRIYDERRERLIPAHGLRLLIVRPSDLDSDSRERLRRNATMDRARLAVMLDAAGLRVRRAGA